MCSDSSLEVSEPIDLDGQIKEEMDGQIREEKVCNEEVYQM